METSCYNSLKKNILEKEFAHLNEMQRCAVLKTHGPVLILAGAGSGKTTVIVNRIAALVKFGSAYESETVPPFLTQDDLTFMKDYLAGRSDDNGRIGRLIAVNPPKPWQILAITFTNKAAGELRARLERMLGTEGADIQASTFHSACVRMLRRDIDRLGYEKAFTIYDSDDSQRVVKDILKEQNMDDKMFPPRVIMSVMGQAKDQLFTPEEFAAHNPGDFRMEKMAKVYSLYQKRLKAANALDFDDIITMAVRLLKSNPDILEYYQNRFRYILVDEYQDTNRSQYQLVSLLAGRHGNLCVVGDDDQSIYKFRGATIENILNFEKQFKDTLVIRLEENYRSSQRILDAANAVIEHNNERKGKTLWTSRGEGDLITSYRARDEGDEAVFIADCVAKSVTGGALYSDHAVLYRMNAQSNPIERALVNAGIPYKIVGGQKFFERMEIKDMVAYLCVLLNPNDRLRLGRIINKPKRGIGDATVELATQIADSLNIGLYEVFATADSLAPLSKKAKPLMTFTAMMTSLAEKVDLIPLPELLDAVLEESGYLADLRQDRTVGPGRLENIEELKSNMLHYIGESAEPTLAGFLEEIALYTDLDSYDPDADAMVMMTIHSAKGLEFEKRFYCRIRGWYLPRHPSYL